MNTEHDPRIERLKEVLSSSYPRVGDKEKLEPLPQSILDRLHPKELPEETLFSKVVSFFAQPVPALGAMALLSICAVTVFRSNSSPRSQGYGMRSGGEVASTPKLILINASPSIFEEFKTSGYFPEDLLSAAVSFTPDDGSAIVLDWGSRTMTHYVLDEEPIIAAMVEDDGELLEQVLEFYQEALTE